MTSLVRLAALAAALFALVLLSSSKAGADDRYQGIVIIDQTVCADASGNYPEVLSSGTIISVFPGQVTDVNQLIGFGETSWSCWVPIGSVIPWDGEPLPDQTYEEEPPAAQSELVVIGEDYINEDDTACLTDPEVGTVVAYLVRGEYVVLIADGKQDGWQLVGLEATICYVNYTNIGFAAEESPAIEPVEPELEVNQDSTESQIVAATPEPTVQPTQSEIASVTQLPGTGVGNPEQSLRDIVWVLAIFGVLTLIGACLNLYGANDIEIKSAVRSAVWKVWIHIYGACYWGAERLRQWRKRPRARHFHIFAVLRRH